MSLQVVVTVAVQGDPGEAPLVRVGHEATVVVPGDAAEAMALEALRLIEETVRTVRDEALRQTQLVLDQVRG